MNKLILKSIVITCFLFILSGCVVTKNIKRMIEGYDTYKSSVRALVYHQNNKPRFNSSIGYFVDFDKHNRYIKYYNKVGSNYVSIPIISYSEYNEIMVKLQTFLKWANHPYNLRLTTMEYVEQTLPNNRPNPIKDGMTDFYLFMSPEVNDNEPYLAYNRSTDLFYTSRFLLDKKNIHTLMYELIVWKKGIDSSR